MTFWLLSFARTGSARYLSHLDTARAVQRTFARAGISIALSQGMRPKQRLSLPFPLPVGAAGEEELAVIEVTPETPGGAAALRGLRAAAPPGLEPREIVVVAEGHPRPQPFEAEYRCVIDGEEGRVAAAVERYLSEPEVLCERVSPKGRRALDLKESITAAAAVTAPDGVELRFTVRYGRDGAARPREFVDLIARWAEADAAMRGLERRRIRWKGLPRGTTRGAGRSVQT